MKHYEVRYTDVAGKRTGAVIQGHKRVPAARRLVPFEKPVSILGELVERHTEPGMLVVDPFAGSGSTLEAARSLGRRCIGIEADRRMAEVAAKRLESCRGFDFGGAA